MMHKQQQRRGFTLREMFVVITVVGLLLGFITMVLNSRREAVESSLYGTCFGNVKQLNLALQQHVDVWRTLPPLHWGRNQSLRSNPPLSPLDAAGMFSWQVRILPFIEEDSLWRSIHANTAKFENDSTKALVPAPQGTGRISPGAIRINGFHCPAVPEDQPDGNCNYVALSATRLPLLLNVGTAADGLPAYTQEPDGMIIADRAMRGQPVSRMTDGASKTAVIIESREPALSNWYDPQQSFVVGFLPEDSPPIDAAASNYYPYYEQSASVPARWHSSPATAGNRTALNYGPQNSSSKAGYYGRKGDPLQRSWGPSSTHLGRILVGIGDGSLRVIADDIDPVVFFSAITAQGKENVVGLPQ